MAKRESFAIPAPLSKMADHLGIDLKVSCEVAAPLVRKAVVACRTCPVRRQCEVHTRSNATFCPNLDRFASLPRMAA